jgi:hypothetical protein
MEELKQRYADLGIENEQDYHRTDKISEVKLPFTNEEWGDLLNKEGEYLPSCCAQISAIRSMLQSALREGGWIRMKDLSAIASAAINHGDFEDGSPIFRLIELWNAIKPDARTEPEDASANLDDPKEAMETLIDRCQYYIFESYGRLRNGLSEQQLFNKRAHDECMLATIMVCVRTLHEKLTDLSLGTFDGYGVFAGEKIGMMVGGMAFFKNEEEANKVRDDWNKDKAQYSVSKCRCSIQKGIEKLV